jgi:hypothetical protein
MKKSNESQIEYLYISVGVMKDQKLKLRDLHVSHTLNSSLGVVAFFVYYESIVTDSLLLFIVNQESES